MRRLHLSEIDGNFKWKKQISDLAINLKRGNVTLCKSRQFIDRKTLKAIDCAVFEQPFTLIFSCFSTKFN